VRAARVRGSRPAARFPGAGTRRGVAAEEPGAVEFVSRRRSIRWVMTEHFRKLERAYASAPVTRWYGTTIHIDDGSAGVRGAVRPEFHHAAHGVHGSVYFRVLDDAAFFAANSLVTDVLVLTASFTVHFVRPVSE